MKFVHRAELSRYNQIPKDFVGPLGADDLYSIHEKLRQNDSSPYYLYIAGSATAESGLMATHLSNDERHARIEEANQLWKQAQETFILRHINDGWTETKLRTVPDRIEMNRIFLPLYHDMVDGNVRQPSSKVLHERLARLACANLRDHDKALEAEDFGALSFRRGLGYELCTHLTISRLRCPSFFTVPAPARADDGTHFASETHDVRLIHQSWGSIKTCIPYEVKSTDRDSLVRYKSALVRGRIELQVPNSEHPLELAAYIQQEINGDIDPIREKQLDTITSNVLHEAQKYRQKMAIGSGTLAMSVVVPRAGLEPARP